MIEFETPIGDEAAQGAATILDSLPTITSEEELAALSGNQQSEDGKKPAPQPAPKGKNETAFTTDAPAGEEGGEGEGGQGNEDDDAPVEYPSVLHYLNEKHNLNLNLADVKELNKEEEAEALDSIIERMTEGVNTALEEYQYIEALLQDTEIQEVLRAKQEGKSLRDLYANFSSSPQGMNDEALALSDFKKRFPKSPDEAISGMVESLKKNGQFEPFVKALREQHVEEQSLETQRAEQQRKLDEEQRAIQEQEELQQYASFLGEIPAVYGVPLTQDMKKSVYDFTTTRDREGLTKLDYALQSNEGTTLAALGIMFMKELINNTAALQKNRARGKVMDKIFETAEQLQSSGGRGNQEEDIYKSDALNKF